jgi:hypothetical protein
MFPPPVWVWYLPLRPVAARVSLVQSEPLTVHLVARHVVHRLEIQLHGPHHQPFRLEHREPLLIVHREPASGHTALVSAVEGRCGYPLEVQLVLVLEWVLEPGFDVVRRFALSDRPRLLALSWYFLRTLNPRRGVGGCDDLPAGHSPHLSVVQLALRDVDVEKVTRVPKRVGGVVHLRRALL